MAWTWVPKATVHAIHAVTLAEHGGREGIRDEGLLESALARPQNFAAYENPDVFDLAASYIFGIDHNQAFVDGNKRTAFLTAGLFLELNGYSLTATDPEATAIMLAVASDDASEAAFARWLERNCKPL